MKTKPEKLTVKRILNAVQNTGGIKQKIADKLGVHRHTIDRYENLYPTVKQAIENELNKVIDKAESNIFHNIQEGDEDTSRWFLARKGRKRGYAEKTEQKIEGGLKIIFEDAQEQEHEDAKS